MRTILTAGAAATSLLLGAALVTTSPTAAEETVKRGEYLAAIMDCGGCHTTGALLGKPDPQGHLGGSDVGFQVPGLGTFYPPNLTPEPETGLGNWSEADIVKAVRTGVRPDGRVLAPVMPYHSYGKLTDADARALATYLRSLKPVQHKVPDLAGPSEKPTAPYLGVMMPG
ncbi:cytochrome c (plasmid) [Skermanella mucosa]|uniref:c-type cytochrome n=1 Tax=Skermanella mucosa TaxID=1789672 RepID=UPI00192BA7F9|nr:cytochrome c [Skermanella mucosa]UEM24627.1 cytochrome c [Skermanella mucosa]